MGSARYRIIQPEQPKPWPRSPGLHWLYRFERCAERLHLEQGFQPPVSFHPEPSLIFGRLDDDEPFALKGHLKGFAASMPEHRAPTQIGFQLRYQLAGPGQGGVRIGAYRIRR